MPPSVPLSIPERPPRTELAPGLEVPRLVTGLWQVADQERGGLDSRGPLDTGTAADALVRYARDGFDAFDMADHYGSAELIAGEARRRLLADGLSSARFLTKWCPPPGRLTGADIEAGLEERRRRLGVECIDLLQLHWWHFHDPGYLDVMDAFVQAKNAGRIAHIGLTNVDAEHVHLLCAEGLPIATNQVCLSLLDRRATWRMSEVCQQHGVRLLAYGTLAGGFLSERWLGRPEPADIDDWSKMKYGRFIAAAGGWAAFQHLLAAAHEVATRHGVTIANVATRWALDQSGVGAAIIGARLGETEHRDSNLATFGLALDEDDHALLDAVALTTIPGDCGDEYRRPPFLTATGDLSDHLDAIPPVYEAQPVPGRPGRQRVLTGSEWEPICGYCRAMRVDDRVFVSGTTATFGTSRVIARGDAAGQATFVLDRIGASLEALGANFEDVVRTRVYLQNAEDVEAVSRVHGRYLGATLPANTLFETSRLIGDHLVEIEAEAVVDR